MYQKEAMERANQVLKEELAQKDALIAYLIKEKNKQPSYVNSSVSHTNHFGGAF